MSKHIIIIRRWLLFFIVSLFISGLTAIPLEWELSVLTRVFKDSGTFSFWFNRVYEGILDMSIRYPFLNYGYDWLAFAHFMFAILFIGPYRDPLRNKWVIEFGMIACILIIPFALIAGQFRGIPPGWRLIDCSFGVIGIIPLAIVRKKILSLINTTNGNDGSCQHLAKK